MIEPARLEVSLEELCAALLDAFQEEFGDEELASLATQCVLTEHLLEGSWEVVEPA